MESEPNDVGLEKLGWAEMGLKNPKSQNKGII